MRVTQQILTDRVMQNLNRITSRILRVQDMLSSGKSLRSPSDDPVRFNRVLDLRTTLVKLDRYTTNVEDAVDWLNIVDVSLAQVGNVLQEIRQLAVQEANGTLTQEDRNTIAERIEEALKELLETANAQSGGKHLFGGTQTTTVPFTMEGNTITYWGDGASIVRAVDENTTMAISFPGDQLFFRGFEVWSSNPVTLNPGDRFTVNGVEIEIDATMTTIQDLVNRINNDVTLKQSVYAFSDDTRLFLRSRTDDPPVLADTSGTPLQDWGILDAGGAIVEGNSRESSGIFKVVQKLIAHLRAGDQERISGEDIANLDAAIDDTLRIRSQVGARTSRLENALNRLGDFALNFKKLLSTNEDIDLAEVIMQLKEQQSVYETALAAAAQVIQPTLLDFLR